MRLIRAVLAAALAAAAFAGFAGLAGCAQPESRRSTGQVIDDAAITARVKAALIDAPDVKAGDINVETNRGVVQLSGFVDSQNMSDRAVASAQRVPGVRSVKNDMRVKPRS